MARPNNPASAIVSAGTVGAIVIQFAQQIQNHGIQQLIIFSAPPLSASIVWLWSEVGPWIQDEVKTFFRRRRLESILKRIQDPAKRKALLDAFEREEVTQAKRVILVARDTEERQSPTARPKSHFALAETHRRPAADLCSSAREAESNALLV